MDLVVKYIKKTGWIAEEKRENYWYVGFPNKKLIKNASSKKYKVMISFNGWILAGKTIQSTIIKFHKRGIINLFNFDFKTCNKCSGNGKYERRSGNPYDANCYSCNGFGIAKKIKL